MLYINTNKEELNIKGKSIKIRITKKSKKLLFSLIQLLFILKSFLTYQILVFSCIKLVTFDWRKHLTNIQSHLSCHECFGKIENKDTHHQFQICVP